MTADKIVVFLLIAITVAFLVVIQVKSLRNRDAAILTPPEGDASATPSIESPSRLVVKKGG